MVPPKCAGATVRYPEYCRYWVNEAHTHSLFPASRRRTWPVALFTLLLIACVTGAFLTREYGDTAVPALTTKTADAVDDRLLRTARSLVSLAGTPDEQIAAREALRLADHELDQAFASRLRVVTSAAPPASGPLRPLTDRIIQIKNRIAASQQQIAQLTKTADANETAADDLALAKAQLALDEDELADAQQDLARQGGDRHAKVQEMLQAHEAAQQNPPAFPRFADSPEGLALAPAVQLWIALRSHLQQLSAAQGEALQHASSLDREHEKLEKQVGSQNPTASNATVAQLRQLSGQRKTLMEFDRRIKDSQQLADVYKRWRGLLAGRQRSVLHRVLALTAWLLAVLLVVVSFVLALPQLFRSHRERRRAQQLRTITRIGVQIAGLLIILLILFGPPTQTSTMIGLATAGLTVVLKDFIVAFFGWFVLMGRNGIRVGDWIEIKGVGGEVIEIGLLRTVLLEVGNWAETGHPTGRRVAFVNSFAIEGHYFNFSTAGQWLWDELQVAVPAGGDPYRIAQSIFETVEAETAEDARLAEQDWERVTNQYGVRTFSAKPVVDLRPAGSGLSVLVRYITRAPRRYDVKSRLLQVIVELIHKREAAPAVPQ